LVIMTHENTKPSVDTALRMPSLFVSHGSPMFALEPGATGPALRAFGERLRASGALRGVVVMSPHWMSRTPAVMTNPAPATWHDFGGFPQPLYELQYPAPGHAALGQQVIALLGQAGIAAEPDARRPLDHGAWVPLMHLLPQADVPVVQVALPARWGAREVFAMGQALAPLRDEGILLVGSGSMTHNLSEFFGGQHEPSPYVLEFSRWIEAAVSSRSLAPLLAWDTEAPHAQRAHPTDEHFLPLFFALGAGGFGSGNDSLMVDYLSREVMYGMLAMDSFVLSEAPHAH